MVLRVFTLVFLLVSLAKLSLAQEKFEFDYQERELDEVVNPTFVKKSILGEDVANKMQLLREAYTYKEMNGITKTETTVIDKTSIFNTTKKVVKYFEKAAKKGSVDLTEATQKAETVIDIALNIRFQNTYYLEEALWKVKEPEAIYDYYTNKILLDGYVAKIESNHSGSLSSNDR